MNYYKAKHIRTVGSYHGLMWFSPFVQTNRSIVAHGILEATRANHVLMTQCWCCNGPWTNPPTIGPGGFGPLPQALHPEVSDLERLQGASLILLQGSSNNPVQTGPQGLIYLEPSVKRTPPQFFPQASQLVGNPSLCANLLFQERQALTYKPLVTQDNLTPRATKRKTHHNPTQQPNWLYPDQAGVNRCFAKSKSKLLGTNPNPAVSPGSLLVVCSAKQMAVIIEATPHFQAIEETWYDQPCF